MARKGMYATSGLVIGLFLLVLTVGANRNSRVNDTYGDAVVESVYRIHDGDTLTVNLKELPAIIGYRIPVRIYGIDTPEINDKRADVRSKADSARKLLENITASAKEIKLRCLRRDKYFRLVADVECDGRSVGKLLLDSGLAKPYFGGKKLAW